MAFNGSGVFTLVAGNPVVTGTTISSTWANNTLSDIATGLSTALTKDGQSTPTANIPMGGFKITGLGAATLNGDALRFENLATLATASGIQAQTYTAFTTAGTSTAYTLTTVPAAGSLAENERYQVEWHTTSGATPTLVRDGLTAKNIMVYDAAGAKVAPATGALVAGVRGDVVYDGTDYVVLDAPPIAASETAAGLVELATNAEALAGTDTTRAITPSSLRAAVAATGTAPIFACRAWVNFNGTGTVAIRASGNVSSITDNGTGDYTVNFATAMPDADYCIQATASQAGTGNNGMICSVLASSPPTTTAVRIRVQQEAVGVTDSEFVSVAIFR